MRYNTYIKKGNNHQMTYQPESSAARQAWIDGEDDENVLREIDGETTTKISKAYMRLEIDDAYTVFVWDGGESVTATHEGYEDDPDVFDAPRVRTLEAFQARCQEIAAQNGWPL
jgi:hypothetical protein